MTGLPALSALNSRHSSLLYVPTWMVRHKSSGRNCRTCRCVCDVCSGGFTSIKNPKRWTGKRIGFNLIFAPHFHQKLSEFNPYLNIISKHLFRVLTFGHCLGIDPQIHRPQPLIKGTMWLSSIFTGNGEKQAATRDVRTPAPSWCTFCPPTYRRRLFSSFIFVWNPWIFFGQMRFMTLAFCISKLSHRILTVGGGEAGRYSDGKRSQQTV